MSLNGMQVMTVFGAVPPAALGYTDGHTHLWIDPVPGGDPEGPVLDNAELIELELREYRQAGGGGMIDCQPGGCGRDGNRLLTLSQQSGVHIVACTGFHLRRYYPADPPLWKMKAEAAAAYFKSELTEALFETRASRQPVRAGFIKIAGEATLAETPRHLLEAAALVCRETGCAIEMHTEKGAAVEDFLRFFSDHQVEPARLIFCHVDKRPDFQFHQAVAQSGAALEYDTFFRPKYDPETNVWPLLERMIGAGLGSHIILANDMADRSMWRLMGGGPGLASLLTVIKVRLEKLGVPTDLIQLLLGGNIAGRLAGSAPS